MSYTAPPVLPDHVGILSFGPSGAADNRASMASGAWPTTNLAIYVPVRVFTRAIVVKLGIYNGFTASGNFDVGIYDSAGTRLVSAGSTAHSGTTVWQIIDTTDTTIEPGLYYFAACFDNTTATVLRRSFTAPQALANGVLSEAVGSVTLPATATWTADQTLAFAPLIAAYLSTSYT